MSVGYPFYINDYYIEGPGDLDPLLNEYIHMDDIPHYIDPVLRVSDIFHLLNNSGYCTIDFIEALRTHTYDYESMYDTDGLDYFDDCFIDENPDG